jgi:hypothetical protein
MKIKHPAAVIARRWAYTGIVVGGLASIAGNVTSTVLTESEVHLGFRIPWAVLWPVLVYIGIEVLTRTDWRKGPAHWAARLVLIGPVSMVAALVSYLHIHHLMRLSGEIGLAQAVGPLAIDGTLFGCTVVLLLTRAAAEKTEHLSAPATIVEAGVTAEGPTLAPTIEYAPRPEPVVVPESEEVRAYALADLLPAPVSAPPAIPGLDLGEPMKLPGWEAPAPPAPAARKTRGPRKDWDRDRARKLLLEGKTCPAVAAELGNNVDRKTVQRLRAKMIEAGELSE